MAQSEIIERLLAERLIPVLRFDSVEEARVSGECLLEAGYGCLEVSLLTPRATELIAALRTRLGGGFLLGAGTVLDVERASACVAAGADFLVSPCEVDGLIRTAHEAGRACLAGAYTPSEVWRAHRAGADAIKLFPASLGGPAYLGTLHALFPHARLVPVGGVTLGNLAGYFAAGAQAVGVGGDLIDRAALAQGRRGAAVARAAAFRQAALAARGP
jgi:2-dehydro-3-deoxyphosphogluconate aldolase/(4S)-4-hydroxy-2-oxoglutarate aldolase